MTALIFICTGSDYWKFLGPAIESANRHFPADILLFTDSPTQYRVARPAHCGGIKQVQVEHQGWPRATLMRYHLFLTERDWLSRYDHVFYLDIDMTVTSHVGDEILADGIVGVVHSSFAGRPKSTWTPEEDPRSTACLKKEQMRRYYTGCFQGGSTPAFLAMCEEISKNIDVDNANDFIATWHDESHLNRYLYDHPPAKELGQSYNAWPLPYRSKSDPTPKIERADKRDANGKWENRPAVNGKQPKR